jgi:biopolymer transport protein ExbB
MGGLGGGDASGSLSGRIGPTFRRRFADVPPTFRQRSRIRSVPNEPSGFLELMDRGGVAMWPMLALSVISISLVIERLWFWWRNRGRDVSRLAAALRQGRTAEVLAIAGDQADVHARFAGILAEHGATEAVAAEAADAVRPAIDRFMIGLSTIVTAAPMLGILGTVLGIIDSFELLGGENAITDPNEVSAGIAQALVSTAAGLVVALSTLFPFMAFRARAERAIGRLEALAAAAAQGRESASAVRAPSRDPARSS